MPRTVGSKGGKYGNAIDKEKFEKLCALMCTREEICGFFGVSDDTLIRWCKQEYNGNTFLDVYKEKSAVGKIALRRYQMKQAEKNAVMAIFLGKQYLGQKDVVEETTHEVVQFVNDIPKIEE